jgi:hypothetical protein
MPTPSNDVRLWLVCGGYAAHTIEKRLLDWRGWASLFLRLDLRRRDFYAVNEVFFLFTFACVLS